MPARKRVDALVVASLVLTEPETELLRALGVPIGVLGVQHDQFYCTRIDDHRGASIAVGHLLELGHRRIGLIGGEMADPMRFTPPHHRRSGLHRHACRRPASNTNAASKRSATSPSPAARRRRLS